MPCKSILQYVWRLGEKPRLFPRRILGTYRDRPNLKVGSAKFGAGRLAERSGDGSQEGFGYQQGGFRFGEEWIDLDHRDMNAEQRLHDQVAEQAADAKRAFHEYAARKAGETVY